MTRTTYRVAGSLLTLALLAAAAIGWGCDKHRRTYVETYGTVGVALPAPSPAPAAAMVPPPPPPQYSQGYAQPPAAPAAAAQPTYAPPAEAAAPAQPQYQQAYEQPLAQSAAQPPADQSGVEVLARGPVHEAFAEPVMTNPAPGITINGAPPEAVQEMPPADRPAGAIWIPGYWAWDDDRSDFIWVSGMWRIAPPASRWVPGYWAPVADGYQWIPGFWLADTVQQVQYLPTPPVSLEMGPVGVAPSPDYLWTTGYWYRDSLQYSWRPGCWQMARADWVWVPAHYIWTPRGCIFVAGYWDYDMGRRGLLFAPVHFGRPLYARPGYCYSPMVVIEIGNLSIALFSRPRYSHYYFGDYFDASYFSLGIVPWYECRTRRDWYDPIYFHAAWSHRHEDRWEDRERQRYDLLRRDVAARPPRTFALQAGAVSAAVQTLGRPAPRPAMMAAPLSEVVARKTSAMRFEKLDEGRRTDLQKYATSLRTYRDQRVAVEGGAARANPVAVRAATPAADAKVARPAGVRPAEVRNPELTRPTDARTADRLAPTVSGGKTALVTPRTADRLTPTVSVGKTALATPRAAEVQTSRPVEKAPVEVRKPQPFVPLSVQPAAKQPQPQAAAPTAPEVRRSQLVQPTPPARQPSPIPQEIKRPQPQVAVPEARRVEPPVRPQVISRPPAQPAQPQRIERPAAPQAAPAPRPQAQPQRIERPAAPVAPPQAAPAPQARSVERPQPPRIEAPRTAPQAAPRVQEAGPRFTQPTAEEKEKGNERRR